MVEITPAILENNWSDIEDKIKLVEGVTKWVHIDVADGQFVPVVTWGAPDDLELLTGTAKIEVHLMVEHPEEVVAVWMNVADRLVVHLEATEKIEDLVDAFQFTNTKLGLAILLETPIADIVPYAHRVDVIQLMGIKKVGFQGEKFDPITLARIKELRAKAPTAKIQIDGGVNLETGRDAVAAGADTLVIGSALWDSGDVEGIIEKFKEL
ncbi:MAG: ribulose-phosphate 3-epimerase [Patescibacteria group bacterium]